MRRLRAARRMGLASALSLFPVLLGHELYSFGVEHRMIHWSDAGCYAGECAGIGIVLFTLVVMVAAASGLFAALGLVFPSLSHLRALLVPAWLATAVMGFSIIANGYRAAFGATWLFHEPFLELMLHPIFTPVILAIGVATFLWLSGAPEPRQSEL